MTGCTRINMCLILVGFLILSISSSEFLDAADTLLPNQSIKDGQTLVSANQTFELGFFSPGNSSNRYVGIWYHNIAQQTVVWVANRASPVTDRSGSLILDGDDGLVIIDGRGSAFVVAPGCAATNTVATLMDTGNLVLREINNSSRVSWQSFDYPTDTFLPGMKLGMTGKRNRLLTSWTSLDDPAPGEFSLGGDPNGTKQFFIWQNNHIYWPSGVWDGTRFSNVPEMTADYIYNYGYIKLGNGTYFTYTIKDDSIISRLAIAVSGQIQALTWLDSLQEWVLFWAQPRPQCDVYNLCGDFGVCYEDSLPTCQCLTGFQPGQSSDWNKEDRAGGCVRKTDLQCETGGKQDGFLPLTHLTFPLDAQTLDVSSRRECESACLRNCSCIAYAFSDGCRLWGPKKLEDLKTSSSDVNGKDGTLYLRLAASEFRENKKRLQTILIVTAILGTLLLISMSFWWIKKHRGKSTLNQEQSLFILGTDIARKLGEDKDSDGEFTVFGLSHVADATNNFSVENKLGEGGFGPVYKGCLPGGQEIAVKRLSTRSGQGLEEFKNEILLIAKLQHRNLVRLLGCCIQGEEKILIYEYMPNKSLDFFLFDPTRRAQLDWGRRLHIIEGIGQGLLYLHKHSRLRIIHRDLKASNILLDGDLNPKISDFGMARMFTTNEIQANTTRVVGTFGYMSPEYASEGLFSIKSDVFSFGVLLLEIISGKRNAGFHQHGNSLNLLGYAWELWKEGKWLELMDSSLLDACPTAELSKCIHVGLLCVQERAVDRPTTSDVITMLSSEGASIPEPKQPAFFTSRIVAGEHFQSNTPQKCSINDVTITAIDGR